MGRPASDFPAEWRERIRQAYPQYDQAVATHNLDGRESALEVLYRAAGSVYKGNRHPLNENRTLPGGVTVGEVLRAAGILQ